LLERFVKSASSSQQVKIEENMDANRRVKIYQRLVSRGGFLRKIPRSKLLKQGVFLISGLGFKRDTGKKA